LRSGSAKKQAETKEIAKFSSQCGSKISASAEICPTFGIRQGNILLNNAHLEKIVWVELNQSDPESLSLLA
jgi:hypothetical protein